MSSIEFLLNQFKKNCTLDLRALGLMRIGIGLVIFIDLAMRFSDLEAHYTDYGVLPLEALFRYSWDYHYFSIYTIANSWQLITFLFLINIICSCCLIVGYRTRLITAICWIFLLSLHNRNPLINQGGDDLLRLILFLGIFLPWGYCYSLDSIKSHSIKLNSYSYTSVTGTVYIFQIICMYVFSALLKTSPEWTSDYSALYYALSLDQILLPFGKILYPNYKLLSIITFTVFYTELLLPFVLVFPFFQNYLRILFFVIITFMHVGIALSLNVGLFPLISIICSLGILPSSIFNSIDRMNFTYFLKGFISKIPVKRSMKDDTCFPKEKFMLSNVMFLLLVFILVINLTTIKKLTISYDNNFNWIFKTIRIDQHWAMFAPSVFKDDGWFVFLGKTEDGRLINIHETVIDNQVNYGKPVYVAGTYKNDRWRKYSEGILMISNAHFRPFYCAYLLNQWNKNHQERKINYLEIIYMKEKTLPAYTLNQPTKEMLCNCSFILK